MRLLAELDTGKGVGLIERKKQGQGKPTRIYVKRFTTQEIPPQPEKKPEPPAPPPGVEFADVQKSDFPTSRRRKNPPQEVEETDPNQTKRNQLDFIQLVASLELWEYIPQTITAAKSSGGVQGSGNAQSSSASGAKASEVSSGLGGEYQEYLSSDRGSASAADLKKRKRMEYKRNKSPAVDNAKADAALGKIAALPY